MSPSEDEVENNSEEEEVEEKNILNPYFEFDESLGMTTFWSMHLFLRNISNSEYDKSGNGFIQGKLRQTIGPVKVGTEVLLFNNGDSITIEIEEENDEGDWEWKEVYTFRVILQKPIIVEDKSKM